MKHLFCVVKMIFCDRVLYEHNKKYAKMFEKSALFLSVVIVLKVLKMYKLLVKIAPKQ